MAGPAAGSLVDLSDLSEGLWIPRIRGLCMMVRCELCRKWLVKLDGYPSVCFICTANLNRWNELNRRGPSD